MKNIILVTVVIFGYFNTQAQNGTLDATNGVIVGDNTTTTTNGAIKYDGNDFWGLKLGNWQSLTGSGNSIWSATGSDAYFLGKVGIGLNNPATSLDLNGDFVLRGNRRIDFKALGSNTSLAALTFNGTDLYLGASRSNGKLYLQGDNEVNLRVNTPAIGYVTYLKIKNNGRIGMGVSDPKEKLDINGAIRVGTTTNSNQGSIRYTGGDFEGYTSSGWQSFTLGSSGSSFWYEPNTGLSEIQYNGNKISILNSVVVPNQILTIDPINGLDFSESGSNGHFTYGADFIKSNFVGANLSINSSRIQYSDISGLSNTELELDNLKFGCVPLGSCSTYYGKGAWYLSDAPSNFANFDIANGLFIQTPTNSLTASAEVVSIGSTSSFLEIDEFKININDEIELSESTLQINNKDTHIGNDAGHPNDENNYNTLIGADAYGGNGSAGGSQYNTVLGYDARVGAINCNQSVILGARANGSGATSVNEIVIGYDATGKGQNTAVIGNASLASVYLNQNGLANLFAGNTQINGTATVGTLTSFASSNDLRVTSGGQLCLSSSDRRLKDNITKVENALDKINKLRGVSFTWKDDINAGVQFGMIAQEVQEVIPEIVNEDDRGFLSVDYSEMTGVFIEAIKEQEQKILKQKKEIDRQKNKIELLENQNSEILKRLEKLENN